MAQKQGNPPRPDLALALILLFLAGCMSPPLIGASWSHPTKDVPEHARDQIFCERAAEVEYAHTDGSAPYGDFRLDSMKQCMAQKGYTLDQ